MDFSNAYYGQGSGQPYQFIGQVGMLTPGHSHHSASVPSDEYANQSPPEGYDGFSGNGDQFQNLDQYAQFNHHQNQPHTSSFRNPPGPPTPPTHPPLSGQQGHSHLNDIAPRKLPNEPQHGDATKIDSDQAARTGSISEDDDMTPAQSRRKAQNRAAQRAFRERKEKHVKDLEAKLASMEAQQTLTSSENEKLRRDLQRMSTENEILRATNHHPSSSHPNHPRGAAAAADEPPMTTGPMGYNPNAFFSDLLDGHDNKTPSHRVVQSEGGERLLAAGATWDYINSHELFKKGMVDVGGVSERLKCKARCDGQGPVFEERAILAAIEASVASGSDELL